MKTCWNLIGTKLFIGGWFFGSAMRCFKEFLRASSERGCVLTSDELESRAEQSWVPLSRQLPQQSQQTGLKNQAKFLPSRTWLKAWAETLKEGGEMRGEERKREEVEWRGYKTRPDGLVCSKKGIAAGAYGVWREKERSTETRERLWAETRPPL